MDNAWEFRWASESGAQGMAYPEELIYLGFTRLRPHPVYPGAWLMVRTVPRETA